MDGLTENLTSVKLSKHEERLIDNLRRLAVLVQHGTITITAHVHNQQIKEAELHIGNIKG